MNYAETSRKIPELIDQLQRVKTDYQYESKYIGEAISMLRLLKDIIDGK